MIEIDGAHGEGGGQMLRLALTLSMLTGKAFSVRAIRVARPKPGLRPQHISCVRLAQQLCDASVEGLEEGSLELKFYPRTLRSRTISLDVGSAGSLTLLLQVAIPAALFGPKRLRLRLRGGTDVPWSPPMDYFKFVLLPFIRRLGIVELSVPRRGFYPAGGGEVEVRIKPAFPRGEGDFSRYVSEVRASCKPLMCLHRPGLLAIRGVAFASSELEKDVVAERMAQGARHALTQLNVPIRFETMYGPSDSTGAILTAWAIYGDEDGSQFILGASSLGARGVRAEEVGSKAAKELLEAHAAGACVDAHMADQILIFLAMLGGSVRVPKVTEHVRSALYVINQFVEGPLVLDGDVISCRVQSSLSGQ